MSRRNDSKQTDIARLDRQVSQLRYVENLTQHQIAERIGMSRSWVSQSLLRTKDRDLEQAVEQRRDYRNEQQAMYDRDIARLDELLNDTWNMIPPPPKREDTTTMSKAELSVYLQTLEIAINARHGASLLYAKLYDRKLRALSQMSELQGLNTLKVDYNINMPDNVVRFVEGVNNLNGDRQATIELLQECAGGGGN